MALSLTLGQVKRVTLADSNVLALNLPSGTKYLAIQPETSALKLTTGAADGASLPADYFTLPVSTIAAVYVADLSGGIGIAGSTGEVVQLWAKPGGM